MLDVGIIDYAEVLAHIFAHMLDLLCSITGQVHDVVTSESYKGQVFIADKPHKHA